MVGRGRSEERQRFSGCGRRSAPGGRCSPSAGRLRGGRRSGAERSRSRLSLRNCPPRRGVPLLRCQGFASGRCGRPNGGRGPGVGRAPDGGRGPEAGRAANAGRGPEAGRGPANGFPSRPRRSGEGWGRLAAGGFFCQAPRGRSRSGRASWRGSSQRVGRGSFLNGARARAGASRGAGGCSGSGACSGREPSTKSRVWEATDMVPS